MINACEGDEKPTFVRKRMEGYIKRDLCLQKLMNLRGNGVLH